MSGVGVRKELADTGYCSVCGKKGKITIRDSVKYCAEHAPLDTWTPPTPESNPRTTIFTGLGENIQNESKEPKTR